MYYEKLRPEATIPTRAYDSAVGYDLYACLITESGRPNVKDIPPRFTVRVPTGLILAVEADYYIQICSRSGLALHTPTIFVANAPGIIDADYRGPLEVILFNGGSEVYRVRHGERIAQAVITQRIIQPLEERKLANEDTPRGKRGYGSSGQ